MRSNYDTELGGDSGETVVSAVIGIALSVLALTTIGTVLSAANEAAGRVRSHAEADGSLAWLDSLLVRAAGRVAQPLSLPQIDTEITHIEIAYIDGDSTKVLSVRQNDILILRVVDETHLFPNLQLVDWWIIATPIPRLTLSVRDFLGREFLISAPLGQVPLSAITGVSSGDR